MTSFKWLWKSFHKNHNRLKIKSDSGWNFAQFNQFVANSSRVAEATADTKNCNCNLRFVKTPMWFLKLIRLTDFCYYTCGSFFFSATFSTTDERLQRKYGHIKSLIHVSFRFPCICRIKKIIEFKIVACSGLPWSMAAMPCWSWNDKNLRVVMFTTNTVFFNYGE